jgi:hypothetical protein
MAETIQRRAKTLWQAWVCLAHRIGNFQAHVLLTVLYAVALFPFGICVRLFADALHTKERPNKWLVHPPEIMDMPWAHRQ